MKRQQQNYMIFSRFTWFSEMFLCESKKRAETFNEENVQ